MDLARRNQPAQVVQSRTLPPPPAAANILPAGVIRATDADRDKTIDRLRTAFADGELRQAEFDARMTSASSAVSTEDLHGLVTDLRPPKPPKPPAPPRQRRHPGHVLRAVTARRSFALAWLAVIGLEIWGLTALPASTWGYSPQGGDVALAVVLIFILMITAAVTFIWAATDW